VEEVEVKKKSTFFRSSKEIKMTLLTRLQLSAYRAVVKSKLRTLKRVIKRNGLLSRLKLGQYYIPYSRNDRYDVYIYPDGTIKYNCDSWNGFEFGGPRDCLVSDGEVHSMFEKCGVTPDRLSELISKLSAK